MVNNSSLGPSKKMTAIGFHKVDWNENDKIVPDIVCIEPLNGLTEIIASTLVTLTGNEWRICIRFDWKNDTKITESDFLHIPETNVIFFKSVNQWGVIDLSSKTLKRQEYSTWSPYIERKDGYVYIQDDLNAETTQLNGDRIDAVPIDPPTEMSEFEDRFEFDSPTFGHQVLRKK